LDEVSLSVMTLTWQVQHWQLKNRTPEKQKGRYLSDLDRSVAHCRPLSSLQTTHAPNHHRTANRMHGDLGGGR